MRINRRSPCFMAPVLLLLLMPAAAFSQVTVYAEGAYTATDLAVHIFADITGNPLCSYGVTLTYNTAKVTVATATKNDDVWYFGTTSDKKPYMNPDTSTAGKIVFIGGKLDTGSPTQGVSGTRVLLGKATFSRVSGQDTAFGISLGIGKTHPPFDNFVTSVSPANVLDASVAFSTVTIAKRGDANADGHINVSDYITVRNLLSAPNPPPYADCNADGLVNVSDYICIRNNLEP